tara:strand:- start:788 stop:1156 length:369 start_codon:yes stop_codon:yes gene_type:complete
MYITDFVCTYKQHDIDDQHNMYQQQLLQAFNLEAWDDKVVNNSVEEIYEKFKDNQDIKDILNKIKDVEKGSMLMLLLGSEDIGIFQLLFRFDLFDITHRLLCALLTTGKVDKTHKLNLLSNI